MLALQSPLPQFFDLDGSPLDGGKIYFGLPFQNPIVAPVTVYWDAAGSQPAAQPLRTLNGFIIRSGTPAVVYYDADLSMLVQDGRGQQVCYAADSTEFSNAAIVQEALDDFIDELADGADSTEGDALVAVNNGDAGEVARTLHYWIKASRKNLCNFLSTAQVDDVLSGAGLIDISTPFATALAAASGGFLELPAGRIRADNLTLGASRSIVAGQGNATRISAPTAANTVFSVPSSFSEIRDLAIDAVGVRSGGWYVDFGAGAVRSNLQGFYFDGFHGGVRTAAAATLTIADGQMLNGIAATGLGIRVNDGLDVSIRDIIMDAGAQLFAGIYVLNCGDVTIEDCNIIHAGQALYLNPGAGQTIASLWCNNSFFDNSTRGLFVQPNGAAAAVVRCIFDEVWFSGSTNEGIRVATAAGGIANGLHFNDCHIFLNGADGLLVADVGATNVRVNGGSYAQNVGAGCSFSANVTDFSVLGARLGATDGLTGNAYGVFVAAGTGANFTIANNDVRGNTTAGISDSATGGGKVIVANNGFGYGSATYNPPSLADGAGATTTVTVTGAVLGDKAWASFSLDLQGITVTAWVSAADTVSVRFQNETGGVLDLASGTLRAGIERLT
jgi:hypothetical protein